MGQDRSFLYNIEVHSQVIIPAAPTAVSTPSTRPVRLAAPVGFAAAAEPVALLLRTVGAGGATPPLVMDAFGGAPEADGVTAEPAVVPTVVLPLAAHWPVSAVMSSGETPAAFSMQFKQGGSSAKLCRTPQLHWTSSMLHVWASEVSFCSRAMGGRTHHRIGQSGLGS